MINEPTAPAPTFSMANMTGSPASTMAGVALIANAASQALSAGTPTTTSGWIGIAVQVLFAAGAVFGRH